jgi:hypothetical protein
VKNQAERPGFWNGALFGMLAGMASLISFQYISRILQEPRLTSRAVVSDDERHENKGMLAMFIAAENLRSGIRTRYLTRDLEKKVLHAGYRNFRESWARDFGFASYGMIAVEQFEVVRDTIEAFFWHQKLNGQLPVKLYSMDVVTRFLHSIFEREQPTHKILKPKFLSGHGALSLDGQALLIISALHYVSQAEDRDFLRGNWHHLVLAMKWLQSSSRGSNGTLLYQAPYADWADSVARQGCILYTNIVYWKALSEMALAAASLDLNDEAVRYFSEAEGISRALNGRLWRPELGYYATSESLDNLSSDGNLLAIVWGLAEADQAESILNVMHEAGMAEPVPTRVVHPSYPMNLIAIENLLGRLATYHTDSSWLWLGALHVLALVQIENMELAGQTLDRIVDVIIRDRQVHEVHGPDGEPLSSIWYKSESPLTWNAGMVLYAHQIYEKRLRETAHIPSNSEEAGE